LNFNISSEKYKGLSANQAKKKLIMEGFNKLPSSKPKIFFTIAPNVVKEPMFILLVACGSLYIVLGDMRGGLLLLVFRLWTA
jgi:Ca2+-transporting ATPase